jgi:hypothetical protein
MPLRKLVNGSKNWKTYMYTDRHKLSSVSELFYDKITYKLIVFVNTRTCTLTHMWTHAHTRTHTQMADKYRLENPINSLLVEFIMIVIII